MYPSAEIMNPEPPDATFLLSPGPFVTSWWGAMHRPVRSVANYLEVRTPVATLHLRGKDIGMRYQARGVDSTEGILVFLLTYSSLPRPTRPLGSRWIPAGHLVDRGHSPPLERCGLRSLT